MTEEIPERPASTGPAVYDAIANVMLVMSNEGIGKDRQASGGGSNYKFRGIDDVYNALGPVMSANRLMMLPRCVSREQVERVTSNGKAMFYTTVHMEYDLVSAEDGSKHTISTYGEAFDVSDKSTGKALSYAYKMAALQAFCIPVETGDNDTENHSHEVEPRDQQRQQDRPRDDRGSGGARGGGQSQANNRQQEADPQADAKKYLRVLLGKLAQVDSDGALDELQTAEGRGISRLRAEFKPLFDEYDHKLGLKIAELGDVPF